MGARTIGDAMTSGEESAAPTDFIERSRNVPYLADFAAPFPSFAQPGTQDLDASFARLSGLLGAIDESLVVAFHITDDVHGRSWLVDVGPPGCQVTSVTTRPRADVEAILDAETWGLLASGGMSPLQAFGQGRMRVRGEIKLARRFVQALRRADTQPS